MKNEYLKTRKNKYNMCEHIKNEEHVAALLNGMEEINLDDCSDKNSIFYFQSDGKTASIKRITEDDYEVYVKGSYKRIFDLHINGDRSKIYKFVMNNRESINHEITKAVNEEIPLCYGDHQNIYLHKNGDLRLSDIALDFPRCSCCGGFYRNNIADTYHNSCIPSNIFEESGVDFIKKLTDITIDEAKKIHIENFGYVNNGPSETYGPSEACGCHTCCKLDKCCEMESGAVEDGWCEDWTGRTKGIAK